MDRSRSLDQIKMLVDQIAARIGAPHDALPTYGTSLEGARPFIEVSSTYHATYHWVVVERDIELQRRTTSNVDQLLYWIFEAVTFSMASNFEMQNRRPKEDSRRLLFQQQLELLGMIDAGWRTKREAEVGAVLLSNPFRDSD
jgi:hypothetical protein